MISLNFSPNFGIWVKSSPAQSIAERAPFLEKVRLADEIFPENGCMFMMRKGAYAR